MKQFVEGMLFLGCSTFRGLDRRRFQVREVDGLHVDTILYHVGQYTCRILAT